MAALGPGVTTGAGAGREAAPTQVVLRDPDLGDRRRCRPGLRPCESSEGPVLDGDHQRAAGAGVAGRRAHRRVGRGSDARTTELRRGSSAGGGDSGGDVRRRRGDVRALALSRPHQRFGPPASAISSALAFAPTGDHRDVTGGSPPRRGALTAVGAQPAARTTSLSGGS
jgi:hypothetical protein